MSQPPIGDCERCHGTGLDDTSGFGDVDACEECHGTGRAAAAPTESPTEYAQRRARENDARALKLQHQHDAVQDVINRGKP